MITGNTEDFVDNKGYVVRGFVRFADGHPAAGLPVAAFDRDLRSEEQLGTGRTGDLPPLRPPWEQEYRLIRRSPTWLGPFVVPARLDRPCGTGSRADVA